MAGTMAEELYQALQGEPYVEFPNRLDPDSGVEWDQLPKIRKIIAGSGCGSSDIQVTRFFNRQHKLKPSGMFELFSKFCDDEPDQIRENLMQYIYDNRKEVESCSRQCLPTGVSLGNWLLRMNHKQNPGDELALFLLCKLFNRHAVVITKNGLWSTLCNTANEGELAIRAKCDICLILVGKGNTGFSEVIHLLRLRLSVKGNKKLWMSVFSKLLHKSLMERTVVELRQTVVQNVNALLPASVS